MLTHPLNNPPPSLVFAGQDMWLHYNFFEAWDTLCHAFTGRGKFTKQDAIKALRTTREFERQTDHTVYKYVRLVLMYALANAAPGNASITKVGARFYIIH